MMTKKINMQKAIILLLFVIVFSGCSFFPDTKPTVKTVIVTGPQGTSIQYSDGSLGVNTKVRVTSLPTTPQTSITGTIPLEKPTQISLDGANVHDGQATIRFSYPAQLPKGVTPNDLLVAKFNKGVNAWLAVPSQLDTYHR